MGRNFYRNAGNHAVMVLELSLTGSLPTPGVHGLPTTAIILLIIKQRLTTFPVSVFRVFPQNLFSELAYEHQGACPLRRHRAGAGASMPIRSPPPGMPGQPASW
jgi:hypothetical protein